MDERDGNETIKLHEDYDDDDPSSLAQEDAADVVELQALKVCACTKEQRANGGKRPDGTVSVCLPCEARGALNAIHDIANRS